MKSVKVTSVKAHLFVEAPKANDAVEFFKYAFDAEEVHRAAHSKRKAGRDQLLLAVELKIGGFSFIVSDLTDDAPDLIKSVGIGSVICLETEEVETIVERAVLAGAISEVETVGGLVKVKDPYGNMWLICSPLKN